jgi:hypothetical protein
VSSVFPFTYSQISCSSSILTSLPPSLTAAPIKSRMRSPFAQFKPYFVLEALSGHQYPGHPPAWGLGLGNISSCGCPSSPLGVSPLKALREQTCISYFCLMIARDWIVFGRISGPSNWSTGAKLSSEHMVKEDLDSVWRILVPKAEHWSVPLPMFPFLIPETTP